MAVAATMEKGEIRERKEENKKEVGKV